MVCGNGEKLKEDGVLGAMNELFSDEEYQYFNGYC
ncbi:hypothetical protein III_04419 [Bacillus mycoides]|uniref:Uncharacterized protein n=1 Tax=Bacillus mycoides TaxID=1405 RepID=A0ABC9QYX7_BACMY|nr:hypothetical protein III_04419 [Bacillus mycoides]